MDAGLVLLRTTVKLLRVGQAARRPGFVSVFVALLSMLRRRCTPRSVIAATMSAVDTSEAPRARQARQVSR